MINTNNTLQNQETQFMIYRDGELDKGYYYKQQAIKFAKVVGHLAYTGLEITVNALDELVQAAQ